MLRSVCCFLFAVALGGAAIFGVIAFFITMMLGGRGINGYSGGVPMGGGYGADVKQVLTGDGQWLDYDIASLDVGSMPAAMVKSSTISLTLW